MAPPAEKFAAVDDVDREILDVLQRDARVSFSDLAARVAMSPNAVAERVRRLQSTGAIVAYEARVAPENFGRRLFAFLDVKLRADTAAADFERHIESVRQVTAAYLTTGTFDYTLDVACRNESDLVELVEHLRARAGVAETYSRLILRERTFVRSPKRSVS
ncbi:MAG TPA: Lrp/AsnC family transcriptional regulator [Candidatus Baltobacteraceae bacterium]|nr:Lrp/AsnC family transcriptional regulator [Candidatus Baltobacteraceae bacterium]